MDSGGVENEIPEGAKVFLINFCALDPFRRDALVSRLQLIELLFVFLEYPIPDTQRVE